MQPVSWDTLAIIGTVAVFSVSGALWLAFMFRSLEKTIYRELAKYQKEQENYNRDMGNRMLRMELKVFGFTSSGQSELHTFLGPFSDQLSRLESSETSPLSRGRGERSGPGRAPEQS